jgi:hypothetical protein
MTLLNPVLRYIVPSTTIGVTSNVDFCSASVANALSPVWNVHAISRRDTVVRSISASGENRVPPPFA